MCSNQNNEHRGTIVEHISEMKDTIGTRFCWDTYLVQCCTRLSGFWRKLVVKLPFFGVLFRKANGPSGSLVNPADEIPGLTGTCRDDLKQRLGGLLSNLRACQNPNVSRLFAAVLLDLYEFSTCLGALRCISCSEFY